jgi:glycosyltransferase involved in cell wall biosynthesis
MKKNKVLIFTDCYIYGGSERLMSFLIRNPIVKLSHDLTLAYRKHKIYEEGLEEEYRDLGDKSFLYPVSLLSNNTLFYKINAKYWPSVIKAVLKVPFYLANKLGLYFIYNLFSHIKTLNDIKPDIIHINNGGYPGAVSCNAMVVAAKILGKKNIIYQVNNMAQPSKNAFEKAYDKFINKNVGYFVTASKQAKDKLAYERKFTLEKILQVTNCVLDEDPTLAREEILKGLSIEQNDFIITVVAFLSERKGQKYLLTALNLIKENDPEIYNHIKVLLVGNGEDELALKNSAIEMGIEKNVFFLGYQGQSINYINACDLFVLPSIYGEDMPLVILTAMSKGKTILATDYAGIREEIENGISGILIPPDINTLDFELSRKIVEIYNHRNSSYGAEALMRFNKLFSAEAYGRSVCNIYNGLINKGS